MLRFYVIYMGTVFLQLFMERLYFPMSHKIKTNFILINMFIIM